MAATLGKAFLGAIGGAVIGAIAICFVYQGEIPIESNTLLASVCVGRFLVCDCSSGWWPCNPGNLAVHGSFLWAYYDNALLVL